MKSTILRIWIALASIGCLIQTSNAEQTIGTPIFAPPLPGGGQVIPAQATAPISDLAPLAGESMPLQPIPYGSPSVPNGAAGHMHGGVPAAQGYAPYFSAPAPYVHSSTVLPSEAPTTIVEGDYGIAEGGYGGPGCSAGCDGCDAPGCDSSGCDSIGGSLPASGGLFSGGGISGCNACGSGTCSGCGGVSGLSGLGNALGGGLANLLNFGTSGACQPSRIWGGSEYLIWWNKQRHIPAFITGSDIGTPEAVSGILDVATTSTLFGNQDIGDESNNGYRFHGGLWLDTHQVAGIGFSWFDMDIDPIGYSASSNGGVNDAILARPFFNSDPGVNAQDALVIAHPSTGSGAVSASVETDVSGGDIFLRYLLYSGYCNRVDFIGGYHHTDIDDQIKLNHSIVSNGGTHGPTGALLISRDKYSVENDFDGGEIGLLSESSDGRLTWSLLTKISFGNQRQRVAIDGRSSTTIPNAIPPTANFDYGLLTLPSNIGTYERDEFSIVPEVNLKVGYNLSGTLRATVGYSFIYWSDVLLAQQTIDTLNNGGRTPVINPTQVTGGLVGQERPVFVFPESKSFWLQGLNLGIEGRF